MTKENLIATIHNAFKGVKLEDGISFWEGQGLDDYASEEMMQKLRQKDERENWDKIPYTDIALCNSSLSFFDAKGMRFCLPKLLIFDILENKIHKEEGVYAPEVVFMLWSDWNKAYCEERFSLLNKAQIKAVIHFLEYKLGEFVIDYKKVAEEKGWNFGTMTQHYEYIALNKAIAYWRQKLSNF
ncbi:MAG: hypothetical protein JJT94_14365 [Bernardetiaceae bacterium]|nr:hypothetical protein [Bernardetiaceae bacterium]